MNPHRIPGETIPDAEPLDPGPAQKCKACGRSEYATSRYTNGSVRTKAQALEEPRACTPGARIRTGFFHRCKEPGEHLHEHCRACGHRWITAFAGAI